MYNLAGAARMVQWVSLTAQSSRVPGSILSLIYSLCGVSHLLLKSRFSGRWTLPKLPPGGECVCAWCPGGHTYIQDNRLVDIHFPSRM